MTGFVKVVLPTALLLAVPTSAFAQNSSSGLDKLSSTFDSNGWLLGVTVIADSSPFRGASDLEITPLPYIGWDRGALHIGIDEISYDFVSSEFFEFKVLALPRWSFSSAEDSELFRDINRKDAIDAGVSARANFGFAYASTLAVADMSDVYNGHSISAKIGTEFFIGEALIDIGGGMSFQDENLNLHLYGVKEDEASDQDWRPFGEVSLLYPLGKNTAIIGAAQFSPLNKTVKESPLIEDKATGSMSVTLLRRF